MKKFLNSLLFRIIISIVVGIGIGLIENESIMVAIVTIKNILGSLISYAVPLIIIGFITPAIVSLKDNVGKVLSVTLLICYISSVGAAFFSMFAGYNIIPHLNIATSVDAGKVLPTSPLDITVAPIMPVMTALVTSICVGIAVIKKKATNWENIILEFHHIVLFIVENVVIKVLPIYIAATFATLAYEGVIITQLPIFLIVILIVIVGHFIWMALLYIIAGILSKTNPFEVIKHYPPAYVTALGTMSSAATLSVSLRQVEKAKTLDPKIRDFVIPLCANTHLCGSVLTETFFVMVVYRILSPTASLPPVSSMILVALLLGIFAIAAPGVPGGTVVASLGLIISVLGFSDAGTALMLSIFALQDSFGTACNITGDGAIALMVTGIFKKVPKDK